MSRKRCHRRTVVPVPPRGLTRDQLTTIGLYHWATVEAIRTGQADEEDMRSWAESCFTWSRVAELLGTGEPEMKTQLEVAERLIQRWRATGRVVFTGPDLQLAQQGAAVMDELACIVDTTTAVAAAHWSEARLAALGASLEEAC